MEAPLAEVMRRTLRTQRATVAMIVLVGCAAVLAASAEPVLVAQAPAAAAKPPAAAPGAITGAVGDIQTGLAVYSGQRLNGRRTASGDGFDSGALTTAHRTLPFDTKVRLTNVTTNNSVVVRVNDRGPTQPNRIADVSRAAAQRLASPDPGLPT